MTALIAILCFIWLNREVLGFVKPFRAQRSLKYVKKLRAKEDESASGFEPPPGSIKSLDSLNDAYDYVIIGSGIGGLSAGAMLTYYGYSVLVLESHYLMGGVAHSFHRDGFLFDAGPSLWNGMATKPYNPLREIMELVGEGDTVEFSQYDGWVMHIPEGSFKFTVGQGNFEPIIEKFGGPNALKEWNALNNALKTVTDLSVAVPPLCLRSDPWAFLTLLPHIPKLLRGISAVPKVENSFKSVSEKIVKDSFLENWFEFLSFALSGLPADGTIAAAVAYTMRDLHQEGAALDYPKGGSAAVVAALANAVTKTGTGDTAVNAHVERILVEDGCAAGVQLRRGKRKIRAKRAVISNASVWDTMGLLPEGTLPATEVQEKMATPMTGSFVHLHIGIDATGLPDDLESHYSVVNSWDQIDAPQNHVIISIPSVLDPSMAPENCHVIHAYAAANEPFALWDRDFASREEYQAYKRERCDFLWKAIERSIPDVRDRARVVMEASPLTHQRFNRRYKGTFGPAWRAGKEKFPYPNTKVPGLFMCGDSVFPGIGVPAVAASGANAASSTVSVWKQLSMLDELYSIQ